MGKIFDKGLSEEDKKEGLFERLENIKDKNKALMNTLSTTNKAFKNKTKNQSKLNNLKTRTKDNEKRNQEVLNSVGDIYN